MFTILLILWLIQIPLAVLTYAADLAYFQKQYPTIRDAREDVTNAVLYGILSLIPVIGFAAVIAVFTCSRAYMHGFLFKPLPDNQ